MLRSHLAEDPLGGAKEETAEHLDEKDEADDKKEEGEKEAHPAGSFVLGPVRAILEEGGTAVVLIAGNEADLGVRVDLRRA